MLRIQFHRTLFDFQRLFNEPGCRAVPRPAAGKQSGIVKAKVTNPLRPIAGLNLLLPVCLLATSSTASAAEDVSASDPVWGVIIALVVLVFTVASAALPLAACRQWTGAWRGAAIFPLAALGLWIAAIVLGKLGSALAHPLWPLEIFAWAMLNMIYMVIAMTAKRTLDKADQEGGAGS